MSKIINPVRSRPRLSLSLAAAALVLMVCIIVPFKYGSTVGYEVAVAGVDKDIALNPDRIDTLLTFLGVEGAHVDVSDCDVKCRVHISELKTAEDARLVAMAFDTFHEGEALKAAQMVLTEGINIVSEPLVLRNSITINGQPQEVFERDLHNLQMEMTERLGLHYHRIIRVILRGDTLWFDGIDKEAALKLAGEDSNLTAEQQKELQERITLNYTVEHKCTEADADSASKHAEATDLPDGFALSQNHPNPFNPTTQFSYSLPEAQQVTIEIFNIRGQKVRTLVDSYVSAGEHVVEWNSLSDAGNRVASGIYFYRLQAGDVVTTKKMTLLK
ncbi:MAG: T9SS type A sorting domain-containing protein [Candidatus Zixiibacteriota bacterium]|nr:MAG: T9SS type A sorting domain-containing protein [candidate division Zixibacteria bacterium]